MSKKVRLGIIGIGNMGSAHARSIFDGKCPEIELTAVADIDEAKLAEAKKNEVVNRILKEYELNKAKDEARRMAISKRIAAEKF